MDSDEDKYSLENQLIEILTGEGKSIILGVLSIVLAKLGYNVKCVCYSEYLSTRDKDSFKDLFSIFEVKDFIEYNTFVKLCETVINDNQKDYLRK